MELTRKEIVDLAKQAGYGTCFYGRPPKDGVRVDEWDELIWGGEFETRHLENFARLLIAKIAPPPADPLTLNELIGPDDQTVIL